MNQLAHSNTVFHKPADTLTTHNLDSLTPNPGSSASRPMCNLWHISTMHAAKSAPSRSFMTISKHPLPVLPVHGRGVMVYPKQVGKEAGSNMFTAVAITN